MTYGPPNPQYPSGPNPQQPGPPPFGAAPAKASAAQAILAPTAAPNQKSLIVGAVAAVIGLLLVVFSFLTWASISVDQSTSLGGDSMSVKIEMSISGLGNADVSTDVNLPGSLPDSVKDEILRSAPTADELNSDEDGPGKPGVWMIVFGVVLIVGGVLIVVRKFPGIGAVVATVAGVAATITAIVFVADPIGAFGGTMKDTPAGAGVDSGASYGLWLTLLASLAALAVGGLAVLMTIAPEKIGGSRAGGLPTGNAVPGAPGFAQPGPAQPGSVPPAAPNYGQQPAQPNYEQQPGQPQGGFPPVPPQGAPGQQYPGQQPPQGYGPPQH
ncbi:hypothetical protein [Gordonia malaquae]|uniref:hypothetical protein n=1 Tax=Gordonia malaquae TaxID=410332 RepID=UPI0030FE17E1